MRADGITKRAATEQRRLLELCICERFVTMFINFV